MLLEAVFMGEKPLPCVRSKFQEPALTPGNLLGSIHGVKQPLTPSIPMENNKMQGSTLKKSLTLLPVALGVMLACSAQAAITTETDFGTLSFAGDAEINLNTRSNDQLDGQTKSPAYNQAEESFEKNETWGQDGRILLTIGGIKTLESGKFAQVQVQPAVNMDGGFQSDDAWFGFGQTNDWMFKVGHFEAFDLYPNGMDIFVDQAGNSADGSYSDDRA